jgi:hypothetical protein
MPKSAKKRHRNGVKQVESDNPLLETEDQTWLLRRSPRCLTAVVATYPQDASSWASVGCHDAGAAPGAPSGLHGLEQSELVGTVSIIVLGHVIPVADLDPGRADEPLE